MLGHFGDLLKGNMNLGTGWAVISSQVFNHFSLWGHGPKVLLNQLNKFIKNVGTKGE